MDMASFSFRAPVCLNACEAACDHGFLPRFFGSVPRAGSVSNTFCDPGSTSRWADCVPIGPLGEFRGAGLFGIGVEGCVSPLFALGGGGGAFPGFDFGGGGVGILLAAGAPEDNEVSPACKTEPDSKHCLCAGVKSGGSFP